MDTNSLNPARVLSSFENEEEHKEAASLFNTPLVKVDTEEEREKALTDTIKRVKKNSLEIQSRNVKDISELQDIIQKQKEIEKLVIHLV